MKIKKFNKKLALNKETIVNLNITEMKRLQAGEAVRSVRNYTCPTSIVWVDDADSHVECDRVVCAQWDNPAEG